MALLAQNYSMDSPTVFVRLSDAIVAVSATLRALDVNQEVIAKVIASLRHVEQLNCCSLVPKAPIVLATEPSHDERRPVCGDASTRSTSPRCPMSEASDDSREHQDYQSSLTKT